MINYPLRSCGMFTMIISTFKFKKVTTFYHKDTIMKRSILIIVIMQFVSMAHALPNQPLNISDIVNRVDHFVSVLHTFNDRHGDICRQSFRSIETILVTGDNNQLFKDFHIKKTIALMRQLRCIEPLFETWNASKKSGYIQDETFLQEFTQIVCVIYQEISPLVQQAASRLTTK